MNSTSEEQITSTVRSVVRRICLIDVKDDAPLISSGMIDSISMVDLIVCLEEQFLISIGTREARPENFDTVEQISKLISGKLK